MWLQSHWRKTVSAQGQRFCLLFFFPPSVENWTWSLMLGFNLLFLFYTFCKSSLPLTTCTVFASSLIIQRHQLLLGCQARSPLFPQPHCYFVHYNVSQLVGVIPIWILQNFQQSLKKHCVGWAKAHSGSVQIFVSWIWGYIYTLVCFLFPFAVALSLLLASCLPKKIIHEVNFATGSLFHFTSSWSTV